MQYSVIGIDFGTSTTVVKVKNYDGENQDFCCKSVLYSGESKIPTLAFKDLDGHWCFGHDAVVRSENKEKGELFRNFKMKLLGTENDIKQAKELILSFFDFLFKGYMQQKENLGVYPDVRTMISFPAKWTSDLRTMMKDSASRVGFLKVEGMDEPTAAIHAALAPRTRELSKKGILLPGKEINVFLIDMGAGTTDISIFTLKANGVKAEIDQIVTYPTVDNPNLCGGREIDDILTNTLYEYLDDVLYHKRQNYQIVDSALKYWKEEQVSKVLLKNVEPVSLPSFIDTYLKLLDDFGVPHDDKKLTITRELFEKITHPHWDRWSNLIADSFKVASLTIPSISGPEDIDLVIATGGHSQWYGVKNYFLGIPFAFCNPICFTKVQKEPARYIQEEHPQETVAVGLTYDDTIATVNPILGNNLWVELDVGATKGEFVQCVTSTDAIPCTIQKNMSYTVSGTLFRTSNINFTCSFAFGSDLDSAILKKINKSAPIPDQVLNYILGIIIASPLELARFLYLWARQGWDVAVSGLGKLFEQNYKLSIDLTLDIHKDGTIKVSGEYRINGSNRAVFTLNI